MLLTIVHSRLKGLLPAWITPVEGQVPEVLSKQGEANIALLRIGHEQPSTMAFRVCSLFCVVKLILPNMMLDDISSDISKDMKGYDGK